jgi:hypothetical protein
MIMSTRLQIVVSEDEAKQLRRSAKSAGLTLSEWARRALRRAQQVGAAASPEQRLRALDRALACGHPTADIDDVLAEIERGRDLR